MMCLSVLLVIEVIVDPHGRSFIANKKNKKFNEIIGNGIRAKVDTEKKMHGMLLHPSFITEQYFDIVPERKRRPLGVQVRMRGIHGNITNV